MQVVSAAGHAPPRTSPRKRARAVQSGTRGSHCVTDLLAPRSDTRQVDRRTTKTPVHGVSMERTFVISNSSHTSPVCLPGFARGSLRWNLGRTAVGVFPSSFTAGRWSCNHRLLEGDSHAISVTPVQQKCSAPLRKWPATRDAAHPSTPPRAIVAYSATCTERTDLLGRALIRRRG